MITACDPVSIEDTGVRYSTFERCATVVNPRPLPILDEIQIIRFLRKASWSGECFVWNGAWEISGGMYYGVMCLGKDRYKCHRVAYYLYYGVDPGTLNVMHSCDNPPCINPLHLSLGTIAQNNADCKAKQRHCRGVGIHTAILDRRKVIEIRELIASGRLTYGQIGAMFGVQDQTIYRVANRLSWSHVLEN